MYVHIDGTNGERKKQGSFSALGKMTRRGADMSIQDILYSIYLFRDSGK